MDMIQWPLLHASICNVILNGYVKVPFANLVEDLNETYGNCSISYALFESTFKMWWQVYIYMHIYIRAWGISFGKQVVGELLER